MATSTPRVDGETLRRSRSEGDISTSEVPHPERIRISQTTRRSESYAHASDLASFSRAAVSEERGEDVNRAESSSAPHRTSTSTSRRQRPPPPTVLEDPDLEVDAPTNNADANVPSQNQQGLTRYGRTMAFFGYGRGASRARRAFVSLLWNLGWGFVQVCMSGLHSATEANSIARSSLS